MCAARHGRVPSVHGGGIRFLQPISTGRWLSRDPVNEPGHDALVSYAIAVLHLQEEHNLYSFVRDNPISLHGPDGRLVGYITTAIAAATYACAKPQYDLAMNRYADSGDKFKREQVWRGKQRDFHHGGGSQAASRNENQLR